MCGIWNASCETSTWAIYRNEPDGKSYGISNERLAEKTTAEANVLANVSGACWLRPITAGIKLKLFLDGDPMFTQTKLSCGEREPLVASVPTGSISRSGSMSVCPDVRFLRRGCAGVPLFSQSCSKCGITPSHPKRRVS